MTTTKPFKTTLCVTTTCDYTDADGDEVTTSGTEYHNVLFCSKDEYAAAAEQFDGSSIFFSVLNSIEESMREHYSALGPVTHVDCTFISVRTQDDAGFEDFAESDFDPIKLKIVGNGIHIF